MNQLNKMIIEREISYDMVLTAKTLKEKADLIRKWNKQYSNLSDQEKRAKKSKEVFSALRRGISL